MGRPKKTQTDAAVLGDANKPPKAPRAKKVKATNNTADKTETKVTRKDIAAQLGELVVQRERALQQFNAIAQKCNELATIIENLDSKQ